MLVNDSVLSAQCEDMVILDPLERHVEMFLGDNYIKSLHNCFNDSDIKYAFSNGSLYGEAGAQQIGPIHYNVWIAFNNALDNNRLFLYESSLKAINFIESSIPFGYGVCFVNEKYTEAVTFAKHLGFTIDEFTGTYFKMSRIFGGM